MTIAALLFGIVGIVAITSFGALPEGAMKLFQNGSQGPEEKELMKAYLNFIAQYGRSYTSKSTTSSRFEIFKQNYQLI